MDVVLSIVDEISKEIAGERELLTNMLYLMGGKFVLNKNPLSYHFVLNSESGAGKDFIMSRVIDIFREGEDYELYTRITPRALDYLHANNKAFTWDKKFLVLQDVSEDILNSSTMKLFLSEGSKTVIVDNGVAVVKKINGRPIVLMTTAYSDPNIEQLRRVNLLNLDESNEQTKRILTFQGDHSIEDDYDTKIDYDKIQEIIKKLKPVLVKIPFAQQIIDRIGYLDVHLRTFFPKILDMIKSSCAWNQTSRQMQNGYLVADIEDYENIRYLVNKFSHGNTFKPMSLARREYLDNIRESFGSQWFTINDFANITTTGYDNARKRLKYFVKENYIEFKREQNTFNDKKTTQYRLLITKKIQLPSLYEG